MEDPFINNAVCRTALATQMDKYMDQMDIYRTV